jgi:hypothetical protein
MTRVEQIAVASGMVAEQSRCSTDAAVLILRIRAKTTGSSRIATAVAIINRHEATVR